MYPHRLSNDGFTIRIGILPLILTPLLMLSACATPLPQTVSDTTAPQSEETAASQGSDYVDGKGYRFTWQSGMTGVVTAPAEIKKQALEACLENGFLTTYMTSIAFTDGQAEGFFNCRGSGGN